MARNANSLPVTLVFFSSAAPTSRCQHLPRGQGRCDTGERQPDVGGDALCSARDRDGRFRCVDDLVDPLVAPAPVQTQGKARPRLVIEQAQEFLVQPVDASWLQCNIECQEACPVGTNCRGYLNLAAEGRFEEGYILSRDPNPVAAMCSYVCSAPCERACRRGDIDRPLAIRAMKRFLVEWHEASGHPRRHAPDHGPRRARRHRRRRTGRHVRRSRARDQGLPVHRLRQPAVRRWHDAHRGPGVPPAARSDRDGRPPDRAAGRDVPLRHDHRQGHHVRAAPA